MSLLKNNSYILCSIFQSFFYFMFAPKGWGGGEETLDESLASDRVVQLGPSLQTLTQLNTKIFDFATLFNQSASFVTALCKKGQCFRT